MVNPLDYVMKWYETALDSMRVAQRVIQKEIQDAVTDRHVFRFLPQDESIERIDAAKDELDRVVVLSLAAVFERTLRDHLIRVPQAFLSQGSPFHDAVCEELVKDIEYWNFKGRLVVVFPSVREDVRGLVKQNIEYRDWVAHGHLISKPAPVKVEPRIAYRRLTDFLIQAGVIGT